MVVQWEAACYRCWRWSGFSHPPQACSQTGLPWLAACLAAPAHQPPWGRHSLGHLSPALHTCKGSCSAGDFPSQYLHLSLSPSLPPSLSLFGGLYIAITEPSHTNFTLPWQMMLDKSRHNLYPGNGFCPFPLPPTPCSHGCAHGLFIPRPAPCSLLLTLLPHLPLQFTSQWKYAKCCKLCVLR